MTLAEYEAQFLDALTSKPELVAEFQKQTRQAQEHWLGLMHQMETAPETAVQWFEAYLKDAGTGRTPLVGL